MTRKQRTIVDSRKSQPPEYDMNDDISTPDTNFAIDHDLISGVELRQFQHKSE